MTPKKRVTIKLRRPNPLFEEWLTEWRDSAKANDSKMQHCFSAALQSLRKYPLPFETGRDCKILNGFGDKLCAMLDERLKKHKQGEVQGVVIPKINEQKVASPLKKQNKTVGTKKYTPQYRSGGYAILISLYKHTIELTTKQFLTKEEIIKDARFYCDVSFVKPEPGTYYTAWSSMRTLLTKNLVTKVGNPAKFSLTEEGIIIAQTFYSELLINNEEPVPQQIGNKAVDPRPKEIPDISELNNNKIIDLTEDENEGSSSQKSTKSVIAEPFETVIFEPNSFEVILLVDKAETSGVKQAHDDPIIADLLHLGTNFEIRHLKIGDYIWICRQRTSKLELVLPYIIERKRMDDFGHSIRDGRYHEQKFRLNQCGIQNVTYLVESYGKNTHTGLPMSTLMQAATNTLLHDGFQVKFSDNTRSTAHYLSTTSKIVERNYSSKTIVSCPKGNLENVDFENDLVPAMTFVEFSKIGSKHKKFTVKEMFIKHLLQLKGLSVDKALAIVEKYPTPKILMEEYRKNPEGAEKLLSTIIFGKGNKVIGPVISKVIHQLYATNF